MTDPTPPVSGEPSTMREALDELAEAFPVDEISDAPWVVERGSIAWMIREGDNGPQVGNFIIEADARWVAAARNAEAEARATPPSLDDLDVSVALNEAWLASNDAFGQARPPDLAKHLHRELLARLTIRSRTNE